mgnify:CR=1 FL=1
MDLKQFVKPTIGKIVLTFICFLVSYVVSMHLYLFDVGVPLKYYEISIGFPGLAQGEQPLYHYDSLFIDIIIWYVLSCIVVFFISKGNKGRLPSNKEK